MVARKEKESLGRSKNRSQSPSLNVQVELDNRALHVKNNNLTQTVVKLQQENAELAKQVVLLQEENFEINSKYNNVKNVISLIDSKTKRCLPVFNEVVETVTEIIQLCSVAASIGNYVIHSPPNKDVKTQAVKPHIVNGHILHNPTITLSRLSNNASPNASPRRNETVRPSTSRADQATDYAHGESGESDSDLEGNGNGTQDQDSSIVRRTSRSHTNQVDNNTSMLYVPDYNNSDEENEEPGGEEEMEESDADEGREQLSTIPEGEEEEMINSDTSLFRQQRILQGRLQEVRIYLNQLPNSYIDQSGGTSNISISVSPPERRSSYQYRSSSVVGEANDTLMDSRFYLEGHPRMSQGDTSIDNSRQNNTKAKLSVSFGSTPVTPVRSSQDFQAGSSASHNIFEQYDENISVIPNLQAPSSLQEPSTSTVLRNECNSIQDTFQGLDLLHIELQHKTSTPIVSTMSEGSTIRNSSALQRHDSPNRSKSDSVVFTRNITKRKAGSREKNKVAQVLLNRLSVEGRRSSSPIKVIKDIVNMPPINTPEELRVKTKRTKGSKSRAKSNNTTNSCSDEENVEKKGKISRSRKKKKKDSLACKVSDVKPKIEYSPPKTPLGRPVRAARPVTLKEPSLTKKLRRSK